MYVVTKDNNTLYVINVSTKKILNQIKLPGEAYTCLLSPDKKELYISCWGCSKLLVYNTTYFTSSMWRCFSANPDLSVFTAKPLQVDINEKNSVENAWQRKSELFDFTKEDRIPDREFTEVIWKAVRGENAIVPAPKRAAFLKMNKGR